MMRSVELVEPRHGVARPVPPILHHIFTHEQQRELGQDWPADQRVTRAGGDHLGEGKPASDDQRLGHRDQHHGPDNLDDCILPCRPGFTKKARADRF